MKRGRGCITFLFGRTVVQSIVFQVDTSLFLLLLLLFYDRFLCIYFILNFYVINLKSDQNGLWVDR